MTQKSRTIVKGHWRNTAKGMQYIQPHVRGPEDAPVVVKDIKICEGIKAEEAESDGS